MSNVCYIRTTKMRRPIAHFSGGERLNYSDQIYLYLKVENTPRIIQNWVLLLTLVFSFASQFIFGATSWNRIFALLKNVDKTTSKQRVMVIKDT